MIYRVVGYFRGVPIFVIFVVNLELTKFSTKGYSVICACAATRKIIIMHVNGHIQVEEARTIALFLYLCVLTVPFNRRIL